MVGANKFQRVFSTPKSNVNFIEGVKSKGILADDSTRTVLRTKEGTIEHVPTNAKDIVNKLFVDGEIDTKTWLQATNQTGLTGDKTGSFDLTTTGNILLDALGNTGRLTLRASADTSSLLFGQNDDEDEFLEIRPTGGKNEFRMRNRNFLLLSDTKTLVDVDDTTGLWDFQDNDLTTTGDVDIGTTMISNAVDGDFITTFRNTEPNGITSFNEAVVLKAEFSTGGSPAGKIVFKKDPNSNYFTPPEKNSIIEVYTTFAGADRLAFKFTKDGIFEPSGDIRTSGDLWLFGDNQWVGVGNQATIPRGDIRMGSDGTNGLLNPEVALRIGAVTTNYMEVNSTGDVVFVGSAGLPYAEIYVKDSTATISVDSDNPDVLVTQFTTNGLSNNCTADAANDKITITKLGVYKVSLTASVSLNSGASVDIVIAAYLNGVEQPQLHADRTVATADKGSVSFVGFIDVTSVPWDLDIRANIDSSTARTLTVEDINLNVMQIGGT